MATNQDDAVRDEQPPPQGDSLAWQQVVANLRDEEKTPLVRFLLQVIADQAQRIEDQAQRITALETEVARLKGGPPKKPASNSTPSALSKPTRIARDDGKRPGSEKPDRHGFWVGRL